MLQTSNFKGLKMKKLYAIQDKNGIFLCHQVAKNEGEAVEFAKMYGFAHAKTAIYVRDN